MRKAIDLTGKKYGKLTVIKRAGTKNNQIYWLCECECGNKKEIAGHSLRDGATRSCGCVTVSHGKVSFRHKKTKTRLYHIWQNMKNRCLNENSNRYYDYGGRGISVCEEWVQDFMTFHDWAMSNGYRSNLSIDRIDVNGIYEPSNCRWVTPKQQANNTRVNHNITYKGETHSVSEWTRILGFKSSTLAGRINRGWSIEKAFNTPLQKRSNRTISKYKGGIS